MSKLVGYCPMGCGQTLVAATYASAGAGGHIMCMLIGCPEPFAIDIILKDRETEHLVVFERNDFKIKHPLRERLNDELLDCALHAEIAGLSGPPVAPGTYRVHVAVNVDGSPVWTYTPIRPIGESE